MTLTVVGCGTLGAHVAARWGGPVVGITATAMRHAALRKRLPGLKLATSVDRLEGASVICMPSSQQGAFLDTPPPVEGPVVFTSSTGVYGDLAGVIGPDSPVGTTERAERLVQLEQRFFAWAPHGRVLRLGGLYEDGRGPAAVFARTGQARLGPPNRPLPLIHYEDAARLVIELLTGVAPPITLGVCHNPTREAFYGYLAAHLGCDPPAYSAPVAEARYELTPLEDVRPWG